MSTAPRPRLLILAILVVITSLGSAFLLGRTLSTPQPHLAQSGTNSGIAPRGAPVTGGSTSTSPTAPAAAVPASPTIEPSANPLPDPDADRPQLPADPDGPFGSRETTGSTEVALTFDDGPDPQYTPQTLALLRHYQVKATFCVIGTNARDYPDLIRAIAADGHTLCNHSWAHDLALGSRSQSAILADLIRTNQVIQAAVPGARISYFRQPGGNWTPTVVAAARQLGMTSLHWAVDPRDWELPSVGKITATVTGSTFAGAIVLMHDGGGNRQGTINALYSILPNLSRRFQLAALPTGIRRTAPPSAAAPASAPAAAAAGAPASG